jgi:hypothetical protein
LAIVLRSTVTFDVAVSALTPPPLLFESQREFASIH